MVYRIGGGWFGGAVDTKNEGCLSTHIKHGFTLMQGHTSTRQCRYLFSGSIEMVKCIRGP